MTTNEDLERVIYIKQTHLALKAKYEAEYAAKMNKAADNSFRPCMRQPTTLSYEEIKSAWCVTHALCEDLKAYGASPAEAMVAFDNTWNGNQNSEQERNPGDVL